MGCGASAAVPLTATIAGELVDRTGAKHDANVVLAGKVRLVLFNANVPGDLTQNFVNFRLIPLYNTLKAKNIAMEVIYVSDDTDQAQFDAYLQTMPWLAVPFADTQRRNGLKYILGAQGPSLYVVGDDDELITGDGINEVFNDAKGDNFPWRANKLAGMMEVVEDLS